MSNIIVHKRLEARLRTSTDLGEIKEIHDKAESLRLYVRKAGENLTLQNQYAELKIRAERRCGELIPTKVKHGGDRKTPSRFAERTLKSLGISKFQSHCWQSVAMVPDESFEAHVARIKDANRELTSIGVYRLSKEFTRKFRRASKLGNLEGLTALNENYTLLRSDFRDLKEDFQDIDIIITDPPYPKEYLGLYEDLAAFGKKVLKPGGSLLAMAGVAYLPEVLDLMKRHMAYHWTVAYNMPGPKLQIWHKKVIASWKPVLWFVKGKYEGDWITDSCKSAGPDKEHHQWGQSESGMAEIIEKFTYPGQTILDPLCGAGTTGVVALKMGRKFIGIDIDEKAIETAVDRIETQNLEMHIADIASNN